MTRDPKQMVVVVSACLLGLRSRYDGKPLDSKLVEDVLNLLKGCHLVAICPEQMGGLPTPRPAMEIESGSGEDVLEGRSRVFDLSGADVTNSLIVGAEEALRLAQISGAKFALLKEGSPSCGSGFIKRGGKRINGQGVTAAMMRWAGIEVYAEGNIDILIERLR